MATGRHVSLCRNSSAPASGKGRAPQLAPILMLVKESARTFAEMSRYNGSYYRRGGRRSPRSRSDEPRAHEPRPESENFGARRGEARGGRRPFRGGRRTRSIGRGRRGSIGANAEQSRARQALSGECTSRERSRGGIGRRRQHRRQPRNIGERSHSAARTAVNISELASLEPEVLAIEIDAQLKEFQEAIGDANNPMDSVVQVLLKLVKLAGQRIDSEQQGTASKIIAEVLSERSEKFYFQLKIAVQKCSCDQARRFCDLFKLMMTKFESLASECLPIDELHERANRLTKSDATNAELLKMVEELCANRDVVRESHTDQAKSVNEEERDNSKFRQIPILPEWEEIKEDNGIPQEVRPNKIDTPYKDWMEYYDIQFHLIREDFIASLRRGVAAFLQGERGRKNRDVKTYSSAKIVSQVTTREKGICFTVQFDVTGFRRVNWEQSKRLIFGSLLCFIPMSTSNVNSIIFATVIDRDSKKLSMGKFTVQFESDILEAMTHCRERTEFEIIESNSYFGATSPILQSIQRAEVEIMPFTKQIINGECESVPPPLYLRHKNKAVSYNLSCLYGPVEKRKNKPPLMIEVLDKESWEAARDSELDSSQLNAIQTALTQEIAVIQGPPGTGKTYIGLKIVEGLLENRHIWDPHWYHGYGGSSPILVMCYTNHALDQFLEGIIDTKCCGRELEVIRVGGRCKNEKVDAYNINKIRGQYGLSSKFWELRDELEQYSPEKIMRKIKHHFNRITFLPMIILKHVAHPYHYYELTQMAQCPEQKGREVEVWLGLWQEVIIECVKGTKTEKNQVENNGQGRKESSAKFPLVHRVEMNEPEKELRREQLSVSSPTVEKNNQAMLEKVDSHHWSGKESVQEPENEEQMIEIQGEASLAQDDRMDDDDIEGFKVVELPKEEPEQLFVQQHHTEQFTESENEATMKRNYEKHTQNPIQKLKWQRRKDADNTIRRNLFRKDLVMDEDEVEEISNADIKTLSVRDKWRLYNYWEEQRYKHLQKENRRKVLNYNKKCTKLAEVKQHGDRYILEEVDVVGMTTTGAAKYQHILHQIKPKIVIVEEAAEVLEAHIVSALSAGTQHLILIGDHKQLRPKPNEHVLATTYNLSISLFERLVMKQMSQATLEIQHRMRPEIAQLVCPHIYEKLLNHESVEKYPDIRGIEKNLFFLCHTEPESENPNLLSYQNEFEAKYIVGLCFHLLNLGYSPTQITILTPYVGQLLLLRNKMPKEHFEGVRVTAIDNFQGEENDIILFSMVRSTNPHSSRTTIGFVKEDNRICVSLSRAKHGFYAIGNFELIRHQSPLWESIISDVESRGCYGNALPLYCCNHPETKYSAKKESDFNANAPNGGCKKICEIRLPCGHSCPQICHVKDRDHDIYKCEKAVELILSCGHAHTVPCFQSSSFRCPVQCSKVMCDRGHRCKIKCHYPSSCGPCEEIVTKNLPNCSHVHKLECYVSVSLQEHNYACKKPCSKMLSCGHLCQNKCYEKCTDHCSVKVLTKLTCGHEKMLTCEENCNENKKKSVVCSEKIYLKLECGHILTTECYRKDRKRGIKCMEKCSKSLKCGHTCGEKCGMECSKRCFKLVKKELPCGHRVECKCHETNKVIECDQKSKCRYPCGHSSYIPCVGSIDTYPCKQRCKTILSCGHRCSGKCGDCYSSRMHAICVFEIRLRRFCGHSLTLPCAGLSDSCDQETHKVPCTHKQDYSKCRERCSWACKHFHCEKECGEECDRPPCNKPCDREMSCKHICPGLCGERCTSVCAECAPKKFMKQFHPKSKEGRLPRNQILFELECGHIFTVKYLDEYLEKTEGDVLPKQCPKCHQTIGVGSRYGNAVRRAQADVQSIFEIVERDKGPGDIVEDIAPLMGYAYSEFSLAKTTQASTDKVCLIQCVNSSSALYHALKEHMKKDANISCIHDQLKKLTSALVNSATQDPYFEPESFYAAFDPMKKSVPKPHLTLQLLTDFKSKLYYLALHAQCLLYRSLSVGSLEHAVCKDTEVFLDSLNPLQDRISEETYEHHFQQITRVASNLSYLHVQTPQVPQVVKGTWKKCSIGHLYCTPPKCGAVVNYTCPYCH